MKDERVFKLVLEEKDSELDLRLLSELIADRIAEGKIKLQKK